MISFDNSFFFEKDFLNFNTSSTFQKNLELSLKKSEKLYIEFEEGKSEILNSFTKKYQKKTTKLKERIKYKEKKIVIGLGGSSSGAKALSFFIDDKIVYFDNLDYKFTKKFFSEKNLTEYTFFIISKSGDTFETLALLNLLILESQKYKNFNIFNNMIIITEDKDSILKNFSEKKKIKFLEHNPNIGGRFSILSETGMLPFLEDEINAGDASEKFINLLKDYKSDLSPIKNVAILVTCLDKMKLNIYCNLIYNYRLKHFSYWFHQLHAESLGKNGFGMTPITSICPKDHHSMMQLFIDGPKDKFYNIFSPPDEIYYKEFIKQDFYNIESYSPFELLDKQFRSTIEVFREKKIPHRVINLTNHEDPLNLIELFSYFILETILLGKVLGVDPYGQPAVQLIKDKIFKN
jgi:glucose-6-phosphate isomerase